MHKFGRLIEGKRIAEKLKYIMKVTRKDRPYIFRREKIESASKFKEKY